MQETVKIIQNAYVLTCDAAGTGGPLTVVVKGDRILHVVPSSHATRAQFPQAEVVDAAGKILLPGFVDAHYHGESHCLHLLTAGEPSSRWPRIERYRVLADHLRTKATAEEWGALYRAAYHAALRSGVTTLAEFGQQDHDHGFTAAVEAFRKTDLRGMLTVHNGDQMELARGSRSASLGFVLALPGADELTTYNLQTLLRQARDQRMPLLAHLGETARDAEAVRRNFRRSPVQVLDDFHLWTAPLLPVHLSVLDEGDIARLRAAGCVVIVTPLGAQLKGVESPPVTAFSDNGIPMALGTDWGPVRPWETLRATWAHSSADGRRGIPALDLLRMHTALGARALGVDSEIGTIAPGKKADLHLVRSPFADVRVAAESLPPAMMAELLLQRASSSDVMDVMINGEFYVREGQVLTFAEDDLAEDVRRLMRVVGASVTTPASPAAQPVPLGPSGPEPLAGIEEGFRVIRRPQEGASSAPILPLTQKTDTPPELPATTRRVFGEDDL